MATYKTIDQARAAYNAILRQKERAQRDDYITRQQAVAGVNNYLKQSGLGNTGAAESILLRAKGNRGDYSAYDARLADLAAIINGFSAGGSGSGGGGATSAQGQPAADQGGLAGTVRAGVVNAGQTALGSLPYYAAPTGSMAGGIQTAVGTVKNKGRKTASNTPALSSMRYANIRKN